MRSLQAKHIQISEIYNYDMLLCIIFSSNYHLNEPIMREAEKLFELNYFFTLDTELKYKIHIEN